MKDKKNNGKGKVRTRASVCRQNMTVKKNSGGYKSEIMERVLGIRSIIVLERSIYETDQGNAF